ncbi:hypothetical protein BDY19DRAFT_907392 [Irpex rosettiformis]|uniref:Uncharacterized protein n=1 Tax=Irpex rosettiformis TaxID=378272 RepID=A0ACB8TZV0_9APHY|nr:hypothetical protein BDY19DRAFT_907392 [Irpex rosettiformis]
MVLSMARDMSGNRIERPSSPVDAASQNHGRFQVDMLGQRGGTERATRYLQAWQGRSGRPRCTCDHRSTLEADAERKRSHGKLRRPIGESNNIPHKTFEVPGVISPLALVWSRLVAENVDPDEFSLGVVVLDVATSLLSVTTSLMSTRSTSMTNAMEIREELESSNSFYEYNQPPYGGLILYDLGFRVLRGRSYTKLLPRSILAAPKVFPLAICRTHILRKYNVLRREAECAPGTGLIFVFYDATPIAVLWEQVDVRR